jgi:hypothetical protein
MTKQFLLDLNVRAVLVVQSRVRVAKCMPTESPNSDLFSRAQQPARLCGLSGHGRHVSFVCEGFLLSCGTHGHPAVATIDADRIHGCAVFHPAVVDVAIDGDVHVAHGTVVEEVPIVPPAAFVTVTKIAIAVIDAAVEAYLCAPVSFVEEVPVVTPTSIAWSPELAYFWSHDPRPRNPKVTLLTVSQITRRPDGAVLGADWLLIDRQFWRGDSNRKRYANLGG